MKLEQHAVCAMKTVFGGAVADVIAAFDAIRADEEQKEAETRELHAALLQLEQVTHGLRETVEAFVVPEPSFWDDLAVQLMPALQQLIPQLLAQCADAPAARVQDEFTSLLLAQRDFLRSATVGFSPGTALDAARRAILAGTPSKHLGWARKACLGDIAAEHPADGRDLLLSAIEGKLQSLLASTAQRRSDG